jgi:hypothetical protein
MALPKTLATLTSSTTPSVIRFQLSGLKPAVASLSKAILEVEVVLVAGGLEYRFDNPKIAGNTAPVTVSGLHLYVNSASGMGLGLQNADNGETWSAVNATAAVVTLPTTLPTGPLSATPLTSTPLFDPVQGSAIGVTPDVVTVTIDSIK